VPSIEEFGALGVIAGLSETHRLARGRNAIDAIRVSRQEYLCLQAIPRMPMNQLSERRSAVTGHDRESLVCHGKQAAVCFVRVTDVEETRFERSIVRHLHDHCA
jgi:hypothetical protein